MNNVRDFGAVGDGATLDTAAIQRAIDAGGVVNFPPGTYLTGTLYLKSYGGLHLESGATLLASSNPEDYNADDFCKQNRPRYHEEASGAHLIVGVEVTRVVISGDGIIDLKQCFRILKDDGYKGTLSLEYECSIGIAAHGIATSLSNMRRLYTGC